MKTIEQLAAQIEELEKRLKMISAAQSVQSAMNLISVYIGDIQEYLKDLNSTFTSHITDYELLNNSFNALSTLVDSISERVNSLSAEGDENFSSIQQTINDVKQKLEEFLNGTQTTATAMEEDISSLKSELGGAKGDITTLKADVKSAKSDITSVQNDLASVKSDVSSINDSINQNNGDVSTLKSQLSDAKQEISQLSGQVSDINSSLSEQSTAIENLQSEQANLASEQENLSNTVSGIDSRLTSAEKTLENLPSSGGGDGGDNSGVKERLDELEYNCNNVGSVISFLEYRPFYKFLPDKSNGAYSPFYTYKACNNEYIYQRFELFYRTEENTSDTSLVDPPVDTTNYITIDLLQNGEVTQSYTINISEHPKSFTISQMFLTTDNFQNFQFFIKSDHIVVIKSIKATFIGKNVQLFENDKDLKLHNFNNNVYYTMYSDGTLYYGKQPIGEIAGEFPISTRKLTKSSLNLSRRAYFGEVINVDSNSLLTYSEYTVISEQVDNRLLYRTYSESDDTFKKLYTLDYNYKTANYNTTAYQKATSYFIEDDGTLCAMECLSGTPEKIPIVLDEKLGVKNRWYYCISVSDYLQKKGEKHPMVRTQEQLHIIAYNEDGYLYLLENNPVTSVIKIGPGGSFVTAYSDMLEKTNVFVVRNNRLYHYFVLPQSYFGDEIAEVHCTLQAIYENVDCCYELRETDYIYHDTKEDKWKYYFKSPQYIPTG